MCSCFCSEEKLVFINVGTLSLKGKKKQHNNMPRLFIFLFSRLLRKITDYSPQITLYLSTKFNYTVINMGVNGSRQRNIYFLDYLSKNCLFSYQKYWAEILSGNNRIIIIIIDNNNDYFHQFISCSLIPNNWLKSKYFRYHEQGFRRTVNYCCFSCLNYWKRSYHLNWKRINAILSLNANFSQSNSLYFFSSYMPIEIQ